MDLPLPLPSGTQATPPALAPAELILLQDMIDALWLEQLYDFRSHCRITPPQSGGDGQRLEILLDGQRRLQWHGRTLSGWRGFQLAPHAAALIDTSTQQQLWLDAQETVAHLQQAAWWQDRSGRFLHFFRLALQQTERSLLAEEAILHSLQQRPQSLLEWERLSCLKDRPFHPLARAKEWDGEPEPQRYLPCALQPLPLCWIAVPRARVRCGRADADAGQALAAALLSHTQQQQLHHAAQALQLSSHDWLWIPVHPWQWHWLQTRRAERYGDCILLGQFGSGAPTASLRSLASEHDAQTLHLKLALSVNTLGAIRSLPPRYLHNAVAAAHCLQQLRQDDPWLQRHLLLCDESAWWAVSPEAQVHEANLINDPGELACLLRRYPALPDCTLIPMAALPVQLRDGRLPAVEQLAGRDADATAAWHLFAEITRLLVGVGLRCLAQGVIPEMHGQNLVLVCRGQQLQALLLRDHDTLRVCASHAHRMGRTVPAYRIDRSTPNTLELESLEQLLAYFQTLALEVNLYALLAALAQRYATAEGHGWDIVRAVIAATLAEEFMPATVRALLQQRLLEEAHWPFKQVLAPLLERQQWGTGMPSRMGHIANPLRAGAC